jgi:hypothetical protein
MSNIEFGFGAQRIQGELSKGFGKAVQREQQAALFGLQSAVPGGAMRLDPISEEALRVILKQYDGNSALKVTGGYALFPESMQSGLSDIFANLKRSGMIAGYSLDISLWSVYLTADGLGYFDDKQKAGRREASALRRLPSDSALLLRELVQSDDPVKLLQQRFAQCAYYEDRALSGMLRELVSEGYIRIPVWRDEIPQYVEIDDSARTYQEQDAGYTAFHGNIPELTAKEAPEDQRSRKSYDLFIAYTGRDKSMYADELHTSLSRLGVRILYDKTILSWGDNLKQKILEGVDASEFTILVITESLFGGEWTEKELHQLLRRQNRSGQKIILPLLRTVTPEDIQKKHPSLSGIQWLSAAGMNDDDITIHYARELIASLRKIPE